MNEKSRTRLDYDLALSEAYSLETLRTAHDTRILGAGAEAQTRGEVV